MTRLKKITSDAQTQQGFTPEQQRYLTELIGSLDLHTVFSSTGGAEPQEESVYGTPLEDLCKEELTKHQTHPFDIFDKISHYNRTGQIAEGIDNFMFRHHGVFNVQPASPGYMCRLRIPSCKMRGDQLSQLGDLSENLAGGYAHVTTRGNFQLREITPDKVIDLITGLYDAGLTCKGSGADSVRNITASPSAGFDKTELIDLSGYGVELHHRILHTRDLHGIPRKFNISFDNGGSLSCVSDTNDIGYLAVDIKENDLSIEPGIYCRILLGGITGHKDFARDTGCIIKPEDTVEVSEAMLRVFIEHGDRTNRNKARLKYVLDEHGFDWFIERTQEKLDESPSGIKILRAPLSLDAPRNAIDRQGHIGAHAQKEDNLYYLGIALRLGALTPDQMRGLGRIAAKYGRNDVRLTVWQNLLIPYIEKQNLDAAIAEIESLGLSIKASSFAAGAVACTGKWACKLASAHTKQHAGIIIDRLEEKFELDQPINIHLTGCSNSCAQHYIGDIGLIGASTKDGQEAYQILLGGGADNDQGIARPLCGPIAATEVPELIESVISIYLEQRAPEESFLSFTRRHSEAELQQIFLEKALEAV